MKEKSKVVVMEKTNRRYIKKEHYTKKEGGGSFYRWFDVAASGDHIKISHLYSAEKGKALPKNGNGSSYSFTLKEAKILVAMLTKAIVKDKA